MPLTTNDLWDWKSVQLEAWTHKYTIIVNTLILYDLITLLHVSNISDHIQEESFEVTNVIDKVICFIIRCHSSMELYHIYNTTHITHNVNICCLVIIKAAVPVRDDTKYTYQFGSYWDPQTGENWTISDLIIYRKFTRVCDEAALKYHCIHGLKAQMRLKVIFW
jgi:hypothetical protein